LIPSSQLLDRYQHASRTTKQQLFFQLAKGNGMALDAYLQIEGISGESQDDKHKNWLEVFNVSWNIHQPRATSASTAGGLTTGRAEFSELTFSKLADLSSPVIQQHCAMGKTIPKFKFEFMRADGDGKPICYYTVEIENVMFASVTPNSGAGGIITEQVHLAYARMKWKYTKQGVRGGTEGNSSGGWCCSSNKCI
jgi:type VI secretion system secreted protein Hcp